MFSFKKFINPIKSKINLNYSYAGAEFVPHSKHTPYQLQNPAS